MVWDAVPLRQEKNNRMTRQDFFNELLILYAGQPEICSALRYALQSDSTKKRSEKYFAANCGRKRSRTNSEK